MIYIEYIERDRFMPVEIFRFLGDQGSSWIEGAVDKMVLQLGRTMRLGPQPSYLAFWKIDGLERLDDWEEYFGSDAWPRNRKSTAMHRAIHIQRGGLYDAVVEGPAAGEGVHYVEYFAADSALSDDDMASHFQAREARYTGGRLNFVVRRIGLLGPDPADLAVWTFASYAAMERIVRERHESPAVRMVTAGIYRKLGDEIL